MGYYTTHKLEIISGNDNVTDYCQEIGELSGYGDGLFDDEVKWYDHEKHMREYSSKYPSTLFLLSGIGEESGDCWREYYQNGKMQRIKASIVLDSFHLSNLE